MTDDKEAVARTVDMYVRSVCDGDLDLAAGVWFTGEACSFIHPRGHERGWPAIKRNFYELTMIETFSERRLRLDGEPTTYLMSSDVAWCEFNWQFDAVFRHDGSTLHTEGRESQLLQEVSGVWRIFHVHYSGMPVSGEREGF
jgi:hypothetical protein